MKRQNYISGLSTEIVVRSFESELDAQESELLSLWLAASPKNRKEYAELKMVWALSGIYYQDSSKHMADALRCVRDRIDRECCECRRRICHKIAGYAAAAVVAVGIVFAYRALDNRYDACDEWISVSVGSNQDVKMITLPDSTKVWINENSTISYPSRFTRRTVKIEGEAMFDVTRDASRPFITETGLLDILVKGTTYNIKARTGDSIIQTTLIEGKVELYKDKNMVASLAPGQQVSYWPNDCRMVVADVDTEVFTAWHEGLFVFKHASITDIATKIEKAYGVVVSCSSSCKIKKYYNFVFKKDQPLDTVLDMLEFVGSVDYVRNGDRIYINEK